MKAGYKDDELFLLSADEFEYYRKLIPEYNDWWWLRSRGRYNYCAEYVYDSGYAYCINDLYIDEDGCVRPALHFDDSTITIGDRFIKYDFPFVCIDRGLAIAEVPIEPHKFDNNSNDYETSEVRRFLEEWRKSR